MTVLTAALFVALAGIGPLAFIMLKIGIPWRVVFLFPTLVLAIFSVLMLRTMDSSTGRTIWITAIVAIVYYAGMLITWLIVGDQLKRTFGWRW